MRVVGDTCAHFWGPDGYYKSASSFLGHYLCHADAISHHRCRTSASIVSFSNLIVIIWAPDKVDIWIKSICDVLATMDELFFYYSPKAAEKTGVTPSNWSSPSARARCWIQSEYKSSVGLLLSQGWQTDEDDDVLMMSSGLCQLAFKA